MREVPHTKSECSDEEDISYPRDNIPEAECPPGNKLQELVELEMRRLLRRKKGVRELRYLKQVYESLLGINRKGRYKLLELTFNSERERQNIEQ